MKKIIATLTVLVIVTCAVFAAPGDQLKITANVAKEAPTFSIWGGKTEANVEGTQAGAPVALDVDISTAPAVVYVKVLQKNASKYKNADTGVSITITPTELKWADDNNVKTALPDVGSLATTAKEGSYTANHYWVAPTSNNETKVVTLNVKYDGYSVAANSEIATFTYTWGAKNDLPVGSYAATITLGYTAN